MNLRNGLVRCVTCFLTELFPLLFVMVEGYPSLLVDEEDMNESGWDTVEHDNSSDKSSAALLSDLLLVLRGEMEISTTTASISANDHNEETRKHQENLMSKEDQDCKKASYSSYHSTTVVPGGKENQNLPGDKTMGATNSVGVTPHSPMSIRPGRRKSARKPLPGG